MYNPKNMHVHVFHAFCVAVEILLNVSEYFLYLSIHFTLESALKIMFFVESI